MVAIARYQPDDDVELIVTALQDSGSVIIENVLSDAVLSGLSDDLRPEFDREGHLYQNEFNGHRTLRVGGVTK